MRAALALAVAALFGCSSPSRQLTEEEAEDWIRKQHELGELRTLDAGFVQSVAALGAGFPPRFAHDSFRHGDVLLYGIESFRGEEVTRYLLRFQTVEGKSKERRPVKLENMSGQDARRPSTTIQSQTATLLVTLLDEGGARIAQDDSDVATAILDIGLFCYARAEAGRAGERMRTLRHGSTSRPLFLRDTNWGIGIFDQLLDLVRRNGATRRFASASSIWPGLSELPGLLGRSITAQAGLRGARVVPQPITELALGEDALRIDTTFWTSQGPLLEVDFVLVPPVGPLAMTAGIVTASGFKPGEFERHFVMRLIGMEQGAEPAAEDR
ncbi:MAG: hypothetical protein U1F36_10840 [Planctomycetota bacterium]